MDISVLEKLIPLLAAARVQSFKSKEFSLSFREDPRVPLKAPDAPNVQGTQPPGPAAPADLGGDELMKFDDVLFHSAPPAPDATGLPLTGDAPLTDGDL